jgi:hypothetical protein
MKSRNLLSGVILLVVGIIALLSTLDVISIEWNVVWKFWPMFLVIGGIAALPIKEYVKMILVLCSFLAAFFLYQKEVQECQGDGFASSYSFSYSNQNDDDAIVEDDLDDEETCDSLATRSKGNIRQKFSQLYDDAVTHAKVEIDFGAGEFNLLKPCSDLACVTNESGFMEYRFRVEELDGFANVVIDPKDGKMKVNDKMKNQLNVALNDNPVWEFDIDMGAADFNFDFSPYKVSDIEISAGVCDMDIKLGEYGGNTNMVISSGVSDINIEVPQNVGCRIINDSAIVGKDFPDFSKVGNGCFETKNFASAEHQIVIELNCAISDITVERY